MCSTELQTKYIFKSRISYMQSRQLLTAVSFSETFQLRCFIAALLWIISPVISSVAKGDIIYGSECVGHWGGGSFVFDPAVQIFWWRVRPCDFWRQLNFFISFYILWVVSLFYLYELLLTPSTLRYGFPEFSHDRQDVTDICDSSEWWDYCFNHILWNHWRTIYNK